MLAMKKRIASTTIASGPRTRIGHKHDVFADGFIRLAPKTHDISLVGEHIPSIAHLAADLASAVNAGWSRRHEARYTRVEVLLLRWEDDDLGVVTELEALRHVFEDLYGYGVQSYEIPGEKPDKALKRRVLDFLDFDEDGTLLVVYYAGHAKSQANEAPFWFANRGVSPPSLPSAGIQSMFEEADSDVVLLYDCCNSAATTASSSRQSQRGVTEVIAACGYEAIAPEVGEHSFSNALTEILAAASKGKPFSIAEVSLIGVKTLRFCTREAMEIYLLNLQQQLHTRVLNRLKCWTPSFVKDEKGNFKKDGAGRLQYEQQPRRTPIYSIICETEPRRSIVLAPLKTRERSASPAELTSHSSLSMSTCGPPLTSRKQLDNDDRVKKRKRAVDEKIEYPQVLLAIRLDKHELDIDAWKECLLRQLPAEAKDIKIEGIFGSFSTLLLLRVPVSVWDLLPEDPAYSFVGFVTSENMAMEERAARSTPHDLNQLESSSSGGLGTLELVKLASGDVPEGLHGGTKDDRIKNPVPSKLKGKTNNKQGNFSVIHMDMSPNRRMKDIAGKNAASERDAAARAKAAQQEKYTPPKRRPIEGINNRGSLFATDYEPRASRPLAPDETKHEQARLLTLLRSIRPITVVDQICKAIAYFGGIPGAPPPEDDIFPESANTKETGALFIRWLAEIFPDLSSPAPSSGIKSPDSSTTNKQWGGPLPMRSNKSRETTPYRETSPTFSFKRDVISPPSSTHSSRRNSVDSSDTGEDEIYIQDLVMNAAQTKTSVSYDAEPQISSMQVEMANNGYPRQEYFGHYASANSGSSTGLQAQTKVPQSYQADVGTTALLTGEMLKRQQHRKASSPRSTKSSGSRDDSDYRRSATARTTRSGSSQTADNDDSSIIRANSGQTRTHVDDAQIDCRGGSVVQIYPLEEQAQAADPEDNRKDNSEASPELLSHRSPAQESYFGRESDHLSLPDYQNSKWKVEEVDDRERFARLRSQSRKIRLSKSNSSLQKRTYTQSIGSSSDDEDNISLDLSANDVGSTARRLRRRTGEQSSLIFDDPPARIEELSEPESCDDMIELAGSRANSPLPPYTEQSPPP